MPLVGTIRAICCDVNETLFAMQPIKNRMVDSKLTEADFDIWFARVLRDGTSLAVTNSFAPFKEIGAFHMQQILAEKAEDSGRSAGKGPSSDGAGSRGNHEEAAAAILEGFQEVVPFPDVGPGLQRISDAGLKVTTMTNGSVEITEGCLRRGNLLNLVSNMWDIKQAGFFKPHPQVYQYVVEQLDIPADQILMVAVHPFDLHGAKSAGLQTAWIQRYDAPVGYPPFHKPPDITATSFVDLAEKLEQYVSK